MSSTRTSSPWSTIPWPRGAGADPLKRLRVVAGTDGPQTAELTLEIDGAGQELGLQRRRAGRCGVQRHPRAGPAHRHAEALSGHAVTEGTDAQAQVTVRLEEEGRISTGTAADTDTLVASAMAYVNALNNLFARKEKSAPDTKVASGF